MIVNVWKSCARQTVYNYLVALLKKVTKFVVHQAEGKPLYPVGVGKPGRVIGLRISHGNLETLKFQLSINSLPIEPILLFKM